MYFNLTGVKLQEIGGWRGLKAASGNVVGSSERESMYQICADA